MMHSLFSARDHNRPFDLVAMGRVAVDFYAEQIGASITEAQSFRKYLGGCAGNIAVGCARLGLNVSMLSRVGHDELGAYLRQTLVDEGVDTEALQTSTEHLTGLVVLGVNPPDRFPLIFFRNDCADMAIDKTLITREFLAQTQALLITGTGLSHSKTKEATLHAVMLARAVNTKVILDIDYRPVLWGLLPPGDGENRFVRSEEVSALFATILPLVDLVVGTEEECQLAGNGENVIAAIDGLRRYTNAPVVLKMGARGAVCFLKDAREPIVAEPFPVTVLNVLGAGDGFMSGLLATLLRGGTMKDALRMGNAAGAMVVARHGCSHAIPSREELDYFIAHDGNDVVVNSEKIAHLHNRVVLKDHARSAPMPIFAFCHRWQLEEVCAQHDAPYSIIATYKTALAQAFIECCTKHGIANPYLLCDPDYGRDALRHASANNVGIIVAIEKSGTRIVEWLVDESAFEILHARPAHFGVKLLMQFDENMTPEEIEHQLCRLKELDRACRKLDRKLMLEIVVPHNNNDDLLFSSINRVFRAGVFPYWWKLPRPRTQESWMRMAQIIDEHDDKARVVILGGEAKNPSDFAESFAFAQSTHHGIGFAVGRSIFWPSFLAFVKGEMTIDEVKSDIAARFLEFYHLWCKAQQI